MATAYATQAEFEAYVEGWTTDDEDALGRLLERASRDIDSLAVLEPLLDDGSRFDPADLTAGQASALTRATCAQAEYRVTMGEDFFTRQQFSKVSGPDFTTEGTLDYIGPKVWREVAGTGLIRLSTSASPGSHRPPWYDFAVNVEEGDDPSPPRH